MADLEDHLTRLHQIVQQFEGLEDGPLRDRVFELLEQVDHVHRSGVWRLFQLVTELGGKGLIERITLDPGVKLLFMLYDLVPVDPLQPLQAEVGPPTPPGAFIPLDRIGNRKPAWQMGIARDDLPAGAMRAVQIGGTPVLLCATDAGIRAFRNACGRSVLPLHLGRLAGDHIECPWHGCRYDVRTGKRLDGSGADLESFSVSISGEVVYVATNAAGAG